MLVSIRATASLASCCWHGRCCPACLHRAARCQRFLLTVLALHAACLQRKPWKSMAGDAAEAAALAAQQPRMLAGVLPGDREAAQQLVGDIQVTLERCRKELLAEGTCTGCACGTQGCVMAMPCVAEAGSRWRSVLVSSFSRVSSKGRALLWAGTSCK